MSGRSRNRAAPLIRSISNPEHIKYGMIEGARIRLCPIHPASQGRQASPARRAHTLTTTGLQALSEYFFRHARRPANNPHWLTLGNLPCPENQLGIRTNMLVFLPWEIIFVFRVGYRLIATCANGIERPICIGPMHETFGGDRWHMRLLGGSTYALRILIIVHGERGV
jgi:hypothetical protein